MAEENLNEQKEDVPSSIQSGSEQKPPRSRWFGRGIYQSKDVPIRLLDGLIVGFIAAIIILTIIFTFNGGFMVTFDSKGGSEVAAQKLRYGQKLTPPEEPVKPGYQFNGWYQENDQALAWRFDVDKVGGDLTLYADWIPARITVKFDLDGGTCEGAEQIDPIELTYQEKYGPLPIPVKSGSVFEGWMYSGKMIEADTVVTMTGEHVLTAVFK